MDGIRIVDRFFTNIFGTHVFMGILIIARVKQHRILMFMEQNGRENLNFSQYKLSTFNSPGILQSSAKKKVLNESELVTYAKLRQCASLVYSRVTFFG